MIIDNIKFKQILKDKNLNKTKLSETLKISTKTIAKISKGENLSDKIVNKIVAFLNVGENDLIKITSLLDHLKQEKEVNLNGRIYEELQVKLTTNTNFVENINLTEDDVRFVYTTQRIACANECIKVEDIIETFNHFKCIDYCIDHAEEPISEEFIKQLHIILKQGTMQTYKYGSGVYKEYENGDEPLVVLNNVSLKINDGEFVVVLGPSGSGKSTLLNAISGLTNVKSGSIVYDGKDITKLNDKELTLFRREYTSFVFQSYYLMPTLTVMQNVRMGGNLVNNKNLQEIIEKVGLVGKENKLPSELSGGQRQRVSIARAIAKKPKVMFCDEPTGALDEQTGRMILDYLIKNHKENGYMMVMVTHNENIALLADKIIKMNSGKIVEVIENDPKDIKDIRW